MARPVGFAEKLKFAAVVPEAVLVNNQLEPVLVAGVTLKLIGDPSVLVTATFWKDDAPEPAGIEKVRLPGLTTSSAVLLTTSFTGIA